MRRVSTPVARAALYARFSSTKQREASIEDQYRLLEQRAAKEGWKVVARYGDKAQSGQRADRPDYLRMLAAARQKEFDVLMVEALDRLARDLVEQERALRRLEFDGIRVVAGDYDSEQSGRELTRETLHRSR